MYTSSLVGQQYTRYDEIVSRLVPHSAIHRRLSRLLSVPARRSHTPWLLLRVRTLLWQRDSASLGVSLFDLMGVTSGCTPETNPETDTWVFYHLLRPSAHGTSLPDRTARAISLK